MGTVSWTEGEGPLVPLASGFRRHLERRGYAPRAVRGHLLVMGQLNRWLVAEGLSAAELIPARVEQFLAARWAAGQRRVPTMQALAPLFAYLRDQHVLAPERPSAMTPVEELLAGYRHYLAHDRGLAPLTVLRYERMARRFLIRRVWQTGGPTGAEGLGSAEVTAYLLPCSIAATVRGLPGCVISRFSACWPVWACARARSLRCSWATSTGVPERSWCAGRPAATTGSR